MTFKEEFETEIDEIYEEVVIYGCTFSPSRILRELDPIAYRCAWLDWLDSKGIEEDDINEDD